MQSRRYDDDFSSESRLGHRGSKLGNDPYFIESSARLRRSVSPFRGEKSQRAMGIRNRRIGSLERRDSGPDLGNEKGQLRTSHYDQTQNRLYNEDLVSCMVELRSRNEFSEHGNVNMTTNLRHHSDYGHGASMLTRLQDFGSVATRISDPRPMFLEDGIKRGIYSLSSDTKSPFKHSDIDGKFTSSSSSLNLDWDWYRDNRVSNAYPLLRELPDVDSCVSGEKNMSHSRNGSYSMTFPSFSKDVSDIFPFKKPTSSSFRTSRTSYTKFSRDGTSMPIDGFPRSSRTFTEPMESQDYDEGNILDSKRASHAEYRNPMCHWGAETSSSLNETRDYPSSSPGYIKYEYDYPSNKLHARMISLADTKFAYKDDQRHATEERVNKYITDTEQSLENLHSYSSRDHFSPQRLQNSIAASRSSAMENHGIKYLDSQGVYVELGKALSEPKWPNGAVSQQQDFTRTRVGYGFGRNLGITSHNELTRRSLDAQYEDEVHSRAGQEQKIEADELGIYKSARALKRKHIIDEENRDIKYKRIMTRGWDDYRRQYSYDRGVECIDTSFVYDASVQVESTNNDADYHDNLASEDWLPSQHLPENMRELALVSDKCRSKYIKGHANPHSLRHHESHGFSKKHGFRKPRNIWVRGIDDKSDVVPNEVEQSQDRVSLANSEPLEDSEQFKKMAYTFFLSFSKKLNSNTVVRQRYKEQGKAGSLFCIVCGRSRSKEFKDTRSLATHAFMSQKVGLSAQHRGLHKAICVLMGWNFVFSPDVTWFPEAISSSRAWAQKEDLILWPPVIVTHNCTSSGNNKEYTAEALVEFLRGKGVSSGKIKVCLGKPSNQSVLIVKFLGTFSGLQDAEKLHHYFAEKKHGRIDFERMASSKEKICNASRESVGNTTEEAVLYGYMGIAEDLDKVDSDTKRRCLIKSKVDIQEFADAPVLKK